MNKINRTLEDYSIDKITLAISIMSIISIAAFILIDSEFAKLFIQNAYKKITSIFGSTYLILTLACFFFLITLGLSKFGKYRLGGKYSIPEFSYYSWIGMLFCSGIGAGIIYWSSVEWTYYVGVPQFNVISYSEDSFALATAYGLFHWGLSAWSIYGIPAIALSIAFYKYKLNFLRLSSSLNGLGFKDVESSVFGRFIDLVFIVSTIGAAGGTIGSYIPMLSSGFSKLYNINNNIGLDLSVLLICISLFGLSVYRGLDKGIKTLSNFNLFLAILFLLLIFLSSDISAIVSSSVYGISFAFLYFWDMSTLGIKENSEFSQEWTVC